MAERYLTDAAYDDVEASGEEEEAPQSQQEAEQVVTAGAKGLVDAQSEEVKVQRSEQEPARSVITDSTANTNGSKRERRRRKRLERERQKVEGRSGVMTPAAAGKQASIFTCKCVPLI